MKDGGKKSKCVLVKYSRIIENNRRIYSFKHGIFTPNFKCIGIKTLNSYEFAMTAKKIQN